MKEEDRKEFIDLFNETLDGRDRIDAITHKVHHDYIANQIVESETRRERWEAIRRQVMGWTIFAFLTAIGTATYRVFFK